MFLSRMLCLPVKIRHLISRRVGGPYRFDGFTFEVRRGSADRFFLHPWYERETRQWIRSSFETLVAENKIFVNAGAHCGSFAIPCSRFFDRVIAIEPFPDNYQALMRNIALNHLSHKVIALRKAAGAFDGVATFYLRPDDLGSLLADKPAADSVQVEVTTIDTALSDLGIQLAQVRLLLVDVEGAEVDVLRGAVRLLREGSPACIIETLNDDRQQAVTDFLAPYGYLLVSRMDTRNSLYLPQNFATRFPVTSRRLVSRPHSRSDQG
ncbi:MAG: FkbM family methyltransferase [bacterium JZ-2024 1]